MQVCVVLVNWNCWPDTTRAAASVRAHAGEIASIVIIDNASSDDSVLRLRAAGLEVIAQEENIGFAAACNIGAELGFERGARYIYLLNPDATVTTDTIQALLREAESRDGPTAMGSVISYEQDDRYQFVGSHEDEVTGHPRWIDPVHGLDVLRQSSYSTDYIMGAALLFDSTAYQEVGPLPEKYFLYYEETAWCYSARRAGIDCRMVSGSLVYHKGSATVGKPEGPLQTYFCTRNELLFLKSFGHRRQLRRKLVFYSWWVLKRNLKLIVARDGAPRTQAMTLGLLDFLRGSFGDCPAVIRRLAAEFSQPPPS